MTDRAGGPSSPNYQHRFRPENYEEDEEVPSDSEDDTALQARTHGGDPNVQDGRRYTQSQDLALARALRLRSRAIERVVISMLNQPPSYHPPANVDVFTPPSSPKLQLNVLLPTQRDPAHPHSIPNGVRLRLALATLINDLFARQPPSPQFGSNGGSSSSKTMNHSTYSETMDIPLPPSVLPFVSMSRRESSLWTMYSNPTETNPNDLLRNPNNSSPKASARVLEYYSHGINPLTSDSPGRRCSQHLHVGCEICVEAKDASLSSSRPSRSPIVPTATPIPSDAGAQHGVQSGSITGWLDGAGIGSGLGAPSAEPTVLRRVPPSTSEGPRTSESDAKFPKLIPRFLRLSALIAIELGLEARDDGSSDITSTASLSPEHRPVTTVAGHLRAIDRVPTLPPSALSVSPHIGSTPSGQPSVAKPVPPPPPQMTRLKQMFGHAFRPSRSWYLLLAGLLTRAVLQGYLTAGWRGTDPVTCLLTFGLALEPEEKGRPSDAVGGGSFVDEDSRFEEFEPDDLPTLREAVLFLFPSLREHSSKKDPEEAAYEREMIERLKKLQTIPPQTPDLATHMEDLAYQFPAEPVERAALRFVEAAAKWRGKPELENNKKSPPGRPTQPNNPSALIMPMDSLVHSIPSGALPGINSVPRPARTSIHQYFIPHRNESVASQAPAGHRTQQASSSSDRIHGLFKRPRSPDELRSPNAKRLAI